MKFSATLLILLLLAFEAFGQRHGKPADSMAERLSDAAENGDLATVRSIIEGGVDVDVSASYNRGWTPLMAAATFGQKDVVEYLLSKGANPNVTLKDGETTLYQAAQSNDNGPIVDALIRGGVDVNARTKQGRTALIRLAWMGQPEAIRLVLAAHADTKVADVNGWAAFHFAVDSGNGQSVRLLLPFETDINKPDKRGDTPLMWAGPFDRTEAIKVLLGAKADVNTRSGDGRTPLMVAAARLFRSEVKTLLAAGADAAARDNKGWTALMYAASSTYRREQIGAHGDGFIVWLAATKILQDLVAAGSDINAQNAAGETALTLAVRAGNAHFAETLLANGADPSIKSRSGKTARDYMNANYLKKREAIMSMLGGLK